MARRAIWYEDNSILFTWPLRDAADRSLIDTGVTVTAELFEPGSDTPIQDDGGSSVNPISLAYDADEEEWQGTAPDDVALEKGDQVDIHFVADGGEDLTADWWMRNVPVRERTP